MFIEHSNKITSTAFSEIKNDSDATWVDVRCPREYSKGHYTKAINIPIFSDEEYHNLGQTYKAKGKDIATRLGYEYALNSRTKIINNIKEMNKNNFIIYCARGGMRSKGFQNIINNNQGTVLAVEALYYLGLCEYELKEFNNAKQSFKEYIRYSQDNLRRQDAEYKICLCMFELTLDYKKEQIATKKAIDAFQTFIEKYPGDKKYLSDMTEKIGVLRDKLALKRYESAKLYIKAEQYESAKLYFDELLIHFRDTKYADDARIGHIMVLLMNEQKNEAIDFLSNYKNEFNSDDKYREAQEIINNTNSPYTIKGLYFIDYIKKIILRYVS